MPKNSIQNVFFTRTLLSILVLLVGGGISDNANSGLIKHVFSGQITNLRFNNFDPYGGQIVIGSPFSGFYEFESTQTPEIGGPCQIALVQCYRSFPTPPFRFSATVGGILFEHAGPDLDIRVNDSPGTNASDFYEVDGNTMFGGVGAAMIIGLLDDTRTAIDNPLNLYLTPPDLNDFSTTNFQINSTIGFLQGRLDTLHAAIPEPSTALLLLPGLLGLVYRYRL